MRPDRVAVYGYAHLPELFKPQRQIVAAMIREKRRIAGVEEGSEYLPA